MRQTLSLNTDWQFHLGELPTPPKKMAKKAYAFGGFTATLPSEGGDRLPVSPGGEHFLRLIAQGDREIGLRNLCATDLYSDMDESWRSVSLPHDWKLELPYENDPLNLMSGSKPDGVGYYRKRFEVDRAVLERGDRVFLQFDGVARLADIWLNGAYLGRNNSGYTEFQFDITELAYYGDEGSNTLLVRADTTAGQEGWWYEGAGIYKPVSLLIVPRLRLEADSLYVYTKSLSAGSAVLGLEATLINDTDQPAVLAPQVRIEGQVVTFAEQTLRPYSQAVFQTEMELAQPCLWSPENPHLYQAQFTCAGDRVDLNFGVRTFAYDTQGFHLNGQLYELRGVCEHQDFAGLGVALNQDIVDYKVKVMKEMGVNAWRSAHHFASKELLRACDHLGILLMNENRLPEASPWRIEDLERMVTKSRQHASLAFWSIGNEELTGNTDFGSRTVARLARVIKSLNYEALTVSAELLSPEGGVDEDYLQHVDILGVNYPEAGVMGDGAEIIHANHPRLPMMSTENASYFSTRGIYRDDAERCHCNNLGSMYSMILPGRRQPGEPGVGGTARPEQVLGYLRSHAYMGGVFLWTAFDYFGEPSPFGWPGIGSQFGIADSCGFPKDYYYYYQAHWTSQPMVHIASHWNREGLDIRENGIVPVRIFSNAQTAELFVNGESQGCLELVDCQAEWQPVYTEGLLEVKAFDQDGRQVATEAVATSGSAVGVETSLLYQGEEITLLALQAVDAVGRLVPTAENLLHVDSDAVLGLGNGHPADLSDCSLSDIRLFSGQALACLKRRTDMADLPTVQILAEQL